MECPVQKNLLDALTTPVPSPSRPSIPDTSSPQSRLEGFASVALATVAASRKTDKEIVPKVPALVESSLIESSLMPESTLSELKGFKRKRRKRAVITPTPDSESTSEPESDGSLERSTTNFAAGSTAAANAHRAFTMSVNFANAARHDEREILETIARAEETQAEQQVKHHFWTKCGQKRKLSPGTDGTTWEVTKSYYKCNFPGCSARKELNKAQHEKGEVHYIPTFSGTHNHPCVETYANHDYDDHHANAPGNMTNHDTLSKLFEAPNGDLQLQDDQAQSLQDDQTQLLQAQQSRLLQEMQENQSRLLSENQLLLSGEQSRLLQENQARVLQENQSRLLQENQLRMLQGQVGQVGGQHPIIERALVQAQMQNFVLHQMMLQQMHMGFDPFTIGGTHNL